jgi:EpsI family protein
MAARILVLSLCFIAASAYIARASKTEPVYTREALTHFPAQIGQWRGRDVVVDERLLSVLAVDDYLNREYSSSSGVMGLYVGFYETQRQGNTIHSPLNCLPGAGWDPVSRSYVTIPIAGDALHPEIQINRIVIEKGLDKALVLYWYQAHGRVIANEYWGRIYTIVDAMRINRTDGALVRVFSPFAGSAPQREAAVEKEAVNFVRSVFPLLSRYLPQ